MLWWLHESILKMSHTHTFLYVIHSKTPSEQVLFRGCCKSCFDTFTYQPLFPLNKSNIWAFPCRLVIYTGNERGDTLRHMTAQKWDKTALIIETQMKLGGVEFHFCPSREMGQGRAAKSSPFVWFGAISHASHQQQLQSSWRKWLARDATLLHVCRMIWTLFVWNNRKWLGANRLWVANVLIGTICLAVTLFE